jgi:hypothetical protein
MITGGVAGISLPFFNFVRGLDLNKGGYTDINIDSSISNSNIRIYGQVNLVKGKAHLWVQNRNHSFRTPNPSVASGNVRIKLTPSTSYDIEWWSTYSGSVTKTETLTSASDGFLILPITNLTNDLALKIVKTGYVEPTITPVSIPGDGNGDRTVDGLDYVIWLGHYNHTVPGGGSVGDYNNDGTVDGLDYVIWLSNY